MPNFRTLFLVFSAVLLPRLCSADDGELWRLVAKSDTIVIAQFEADLAPVEQAMASGAHDYVPLRMNVSSCLKGRYCSGPLNLSYFTAEQSYAPSLTQMQEAAGRQVIAFVTEVDSGSVAGFYFAGHTPRALQLHSVELEAQVAAEVKRQSTVSMQLQQLYSPENDPMFERVRAICEAMAASPSQAQIAELEELGQSAVPALIFLLDDRRPFIPGWLSLENGDPDAFEGVRHYSPELMVDALAAILNQITGESFGDIYNGDSELQRELAVNGWRVYLAQRLGKR